MFLVQNQMASSRTQAQDFIENGHVYLLQNENKIQLKKASYSVESGSEIVVEKNQLQDYVSRAGLKLAGALRTLNLSVQNKFVLDVGQSTGGFTDCLLQRGAQKVIGIDVGHGQLHANLKDNSKVVAFEGLHIKDLSENTDFLAAVGEKKFDLVVIDVSFISLTKVIPHVVPFLKKGGNYLLLVKPQFECGAANLDKNGIVKETSVYQQVENNLKETALNFFKNTEAYIESEILGKDGNKEFFIYGKNRN